MARPLSPVSLERLARLLEAELRRETSTPGPAAAPLGLSRELFFRPDPGDPFRLAVGDGVLDTPVGVAAGPHTQMSQNILSAWLMGARTIELKTVQSRDDIRVTKPCISAEDEGYNCEWSQELPLGESLRQYCDAWVLVHVLRAALDHPDTRPGVEFVMSVGYDFAGILAPNMQAFLDGMANASVALDDAVSAAAAAFPEARRVAIPARISRAVTLSTMHGCPPGEVERIGAYLIEERGLDTKIKLNPTLLGEGEVRRILNGTLGYEARVSDEAFEHDLRYDDALRLIERLGASAARSGTRFALKLTNTLETENDRGLLPAGERSLYMSGRALHPIAVRLALRLQTDFRGRLDLSFSAGADCFSIPDLLGCGLAPVTVCTDLLKPGGYARLPQYLDELRSRMEAAGAPSLSDWIALYPHASASRGRPASGRDLATAALRNLEAYADRVLQQVSWRKSARAYGQTLKTARPLPAFDCVRAPCEETCPAGQAVPEYMYHTAHGDPHSALAVVLATNPFPRVTGKVCDHLCEFRCTRLALDDPVGIRDVKRFVSERGALERPAGATAERPHAATAPRVAVVGAGPSGLACAAALASGGIGVEVFDSAPSPGGLVRRVIPLFRLPDEDIEADIRGIQALGVRIHSSVLVDRALFERLRRDYEALYVAAGAPRDRRLGISGEGGPGVWGALDFLERCRRGESPRVGARVAVIGGGNSAVDAARVARRLAGLQGIVILLYRRTLREMPADHEELATVQEEGVSIQELVAPLAFRPSDRGLEVVLQRMEPDAPEADGRRRAVPIPGSETSAVFDSVITAIGQEPVLDFVDADDLAMDPSTGRTRDARILAGGDALRGPASIILAIADGRRAAREILGRLRPESDGRPAPRMRKHLSIADQQRRSSRRVPRPKQLGGVAGTAHGLTEAEAVAEASRCLFCDEICNLCVSVCPNRANLFWESTPREFRIQSVFPAEGGSVLIKEEASWRAEQRVQVVNLVDWCNECGDCTAFCPTGGVPYRDKPRLCLSDEVFAAEDDAYRLFTTADGAIGVRTRHAGVEARLTPISGEWLYEEGRVTARLDRETLAVREVALAGAQWDTRRAAAMAFLAASLGPTQLGRWLAEG